MKRSEFPDLKYAKPAELIRFFKECCRISIRKSLYDCYGNIAKSLKLARNNRFGCVKSDLLSLIRFFKQKHALHLASVRVYVTPGVIEVKFTGGAVNKKGEILLLNFAIEFIEYTWIVE